jgi:transposase InsO family protein
MLTILDEFTRQWLGFRLAHSIRAVDVIATLKDTIERYGRPEHIRSDNGPEFIAYAVQDWLEAQAIGTIYIEPGSPWENGYIESFHDKIRDECLNRELFGNQLEARVVIGQYRCEYNDQRPHSSLGYQTPNQFAGALTPLRPTACAPSEPPSPKNHQPRNNRPKTLLLNCPA